MFDTDSPTLLLSHNIAPVEIHPALEPLTNEGPGLAGPRLDEGHEYD